MPPGRKDGLGPFAFRERLWRKPCCGGVEYQVDYVWVWLIKALF
jgi:hypothetical protein